MCESPETLLVHDVGALAGSATAALRGEGRFAFQEVAEVKRGECVRELPLTKRPGEESSGLLSHDRFAVYAVSLELLNRSGRQSPERERESHAAIGACDALARAMKARR